MILFTTTDDHSRNHPKTRRTKFAWWWNDTLKLVVSVNRSVSPLSDLLNIALHCRPYQFWNPNLKINIFISLQRCQEKFPSHRYLQFSSFFFCWELSAVASAQVKSRVASAQFMGTPWMIVHVVLIMWTASTRRFIQHLGWSLRMIIFGRSQHFQLKFKTSAL